MCGDQGQADDEGRHEHGAEGFDDTLPHHPVGDQPGDDVTDGLDHAGIHSQLHGLVENEDVAGQIPEQESGQRRSQRPEKQFFVMHTVSPLLYSTGNIKITARHLLFFFFVIPISTPIRVYINFFIGF